MVAFLRYPDKLREYTKVRISTAECLKVYSNVANLSKTIIDSLDDLENREAVLIISFLHSTLRDVKLLGQKV